ncbi:MAG: DUF4349 domain-containing protein [Ignavibacteriae bacterium]|nr:DUF4349 domain-containing protein [Ignavibacteriota bacterium]
MKQIIFSLIILIAVFSCKQKEENLAFSSLAIEEEIIPITRQQSHVTDEIKKEKIDKKKIIKDGRLSIRVFELKKTKNKIDTLISKYGGYYAKEEFYNSDFESSYELKIRIPSQNFEKLIIDIETGDGEVLNKKIDARDVTDKFIDLETRLKNKRNYLIKYNELLGKAKTVKDILEIEGEIRKLEEEIESTEGRLKYLSDLVSYSTLDLEISKERDFKFKPAKRIQFGEQLKQSLSKGWYGFIDFVLFVFKLWTFWILLAIIIYAWRKIKTRRKRNK